MSLNAVDIYGDNVQTIQDKLQVTTNLCDLSKAELSYATYHPLGNALINGGRHHDDAAAESEEDEDAMVLNQEQEEEAEKWWRKKRECPDCGSIVNYTAYGQHKKSKKHLYHVAQNEKIRSVLFEQQVRKDFLKDNKIKLPSNKQRLRKDETK